MFIKKAWKKVRNFLIELKEIGEGGDEEKKISPQIKSSVELLFYKANLAQVVENYDEIFTIAKELIRTDPERCCLQMRWFSAVMKLALDKNLAAREAIDKIENETIKNRKLYETAMARQYRLTIENDIYCNCNQALQLLHDELLPRANSIDKKILYHLLYAEFFKYLFKLETNKVAQREARMEVLLSYDRAKRLADTKLKDQYNLRLECGLYICYFIKEHLKRYKCAIRIGQETLENAIAHFECIKPKMLRESSFYMQLLKTEISNWREEKGMEAKDFIIPLIETTDNLSEKLSEILEEEKEKKVNVIDIISENILSAFESVECMKDHLSASTDQLVTQLETENHMDYIDKQPSLKLLEHLTEKIRLTYNASTIYLSDELRKTTFMDTFTITASAHYPSAASSAAQSTKKGLSLDERIIFGKTVPQLSDNSSLCSTDELVDNITSYVIQVHTQSNDSLQPDDYAKSVTEQTESMAENDLSREDVDDRFSTPGHSFQFVEEYISSLNVHQQPFKKESDPLHENTLTVIFKETNLSSESSKNSLVENLAEHNSASCDADYKKKTVLSNEVSENNISEISASISESKNQLATDEAGQLIKKDSFLIEQHSSHTHSEMQSNEYSSDMLNENKLNNK